MSRNELAPIIIKKRKVVAGDGHHGGAWKVAYADFVTAMMAFFLLMWLLNATTENQRKGLADYFSPTIPLNRMSAGGDGAYWGDSLFAEDNLAQSGNGASLTHPTDLKQARGDSGVAVMDRPAAATSDPALSEVEDMLDRLHALGGESMAELLEKRHVISRVTEEGLVFEFFDLPDAPLFAAGGASMTPAMAQALTTLAAVLPMVENGIAIRAHVAARPIVAVTNEAWPLSTARAGAVRERIEAEGLPPRRIVRVTGAADRTPAVADTLAVRNNRVEVILLRSGT